MTTIVLALLLAKIRAVSIEQSIHRLLKPVAAFGEERSDLARCHTTGDGLFSAISLAEESEAMSVFIRVWPQEPSSSRRGR